MKFYVTLSKCIEDELPSLLNVDLSTYHQMVLYEYIYYLYWKFNLYLHPLETLIPSFYSESIRQIVSSNHQNKCIDEDSFLSKCNLTNFRVIIKRIADKFKTNESMKTTIFSNSIFVVNSCKFSSNERDFFNFLLKNNNSSNIYDRTTLDCNLLKFNFNTSINPIIVDDEKFDDNEIVSAYLSYLAIIVNVRDQLRFSQIFNIPERKLNHQAFTMLRHESEQKNLSMAQVAISYVTRLKLGGKTYAPSSECPLNKYVYGLSELADVINKIQSLMEDDYQNPDKVSVVRKMLGVVKKALFQDKTGRFKKKHIEWAQEKIMENIQTMLSKEYIKVIDGNSTHINQVRDIIKGLLADYAIRPDSYSDFQANIKLGTPIIYNTPNGGCSKNISNLYASPDTLDSPILSKQLMKKAIIESESLPAWPLHGKYQSDLCWTMDNLTPPHIVQKFAKNRQKQLTIPNLNDEVSNDDLFNDINQIDISSLPHKISFTENCQNILTNQKKPNYSRKRKSIENSENLKPLSTIERANKRGRNSSKKTLVNNNSESVQNSRKSSSLNSENQSSKSLNINKRKSDKSSRKSLLPNQKLITSFFQ